MKGEEGPVRVVGIPTTAMEHGHPRYSTSEALLKIALEHAEQDLQCETRLINLNALRFRNYEGYYSKSAQACTWPCSITQMDANDETTEVCEALVHWCDVLVLATPIRWGQASALFFKMAERLNCVQKQITIRDRVLLQNKVASFIICSSRRCRAVEGRRISWKFKHKRVRELCSIQAGLCFGVRVDNATVELWLNIIGTHC